LAINSALTEAQYKCYASNGYPQFLEVLPEQKQDSFRGRADTPDFSTTFASLSESRWFANEDQARRMGLGKITNPTPRSVFVTDTSFLGVKETCQTSTMKRLGIDAKTFQSYIELGNRLAETLGQLGNGNLNSSNDKVFDCLKQKGHSVDKNGPNKDPNWGADFGITLGKVSESQSEETADSSPGPVTIKPAESQTYTPTADESKLAVDLYRCSLETGVKADWDKQVADAKQKALKANETQLTDLGPKIKQLAAKIAASSS